MTRAFAKKETRAPVDPAPFRGLFVLLSSLEAASAEALHQLYFHKVFLRQSLRTTQRMLRQLCDAQLLRRVPLPYARVIYHLTSRSLGELQAMGVLVPDTARRTPHPDIAHAAWLRAALLGAHAHGGFNVGRGPTAVLALRRFLIDGARAGGRGDVELLRQSAALEVPQVRGCERCGHMAQRGRAQACACGIRMPLMVPPTQFICTVCKHAAHQPGPHERDGSSCSALMKRRDLLSFDVVWNGPCTMPRDVRVIFLDDPVKSLRTQLDALPFRFPSLPRVPLILRCTDPDSRYHRPRAAWACKAPRHEQLDWAFQGEGLDGSFAFSRTVTLLDALPDLQAHLAPAHYAGPLWIDRKQPPKMKTGKGKLRASRDVARHETEAFVHRLTRELRNNPMLQRDDDLPRRRR